MHIPAAFLRATLSFLTTRGLVSATPSETAIPEQPRIIHICYYELKLAPDAGSFQLMPDGIIRILSNTSGKAILTLGGF